LAALNLEVQYFEIERGFSYIVVEILPKNTEGETLNRRLTRAM